MSRKTWKSENPAKPLSMDLNKVDLATTGFWWCMGCDRITELVDPGEYNQKCVHCSSLRVKWCPPTKEQVYVGALPQLEPKTPVVAGSVVDFSEEGLAKKKQLPKEKRDLRVLFQTGYYFCFECLEITELATPQGGKKDVCCLCGGKDVRWQDGVDAPRSVEPENPNPKKEQHVEKNPDGIAMPRRDDLICDRDAVLPSGTGVPRDYLRD